MTSEAWMDGHETTLSDVASDDRRPNMATSLIIMKTDRHEVKNDCTCETAASSTDHF
jgi:hypothetical protein